MANSLIKIVQTEPKHIRMMVENLRDDDRREIEAFGWSVNKGLWVSYKASLICKTIFVDGEIAALFGLGGDIFSDVANPWLITAPACEKVSALRFARIYQQEVLKMLAIFPLLENHVHSVYDKAVKLLKNIGFTVGEPEEMGKNKKLFRKYRMQA